MEAESNLLDFPIHRTVSPENLHDPIREHVLTDLTAIHCDQSVGEALEALRRSKISDRIVYFYVIDDERRLRGVVPVRRLLMSRLEIKVADIMVPEVVTVNADDTVLSVCETFLRHRFLALPVVEQDGTLFGTVDLNLFTDEVITSAQQNQVDQVFQMLGLHVESQTSDATAWTSFQDRFPWLLCNIGGGLLCALIASLYESLIAMATVLALFIPIVLALSESVSMQSMTIAIQNNIMRKGITWNFLRESLGRELIVAVMLGLGCGLLVGAISTLWQGGMLVSLILGGSIALSIVTSCLLGVLLPALVHYLKVDPQIAAGPVVLASADILTLLFYFNIAAFLLA